MSKSISGDDYKNCGNPSYSGIDFSVPLEIKNLNLVFDEALEQIFGSKRVLFLANELNKNESHLLGIAAHELKHLLDFENDPTLNDLSLRLADNQRIVKAMNRSDQMNTSYNAAKTSKAYAEFISNIAAWKMEKGDCSGPSDCKNLAENEYIRIFNNLWQRMPYFLSRHERSAYLEQVQFHKFHDRITKEKVANYIVIQPQVSLTKIQDGFDPSNIVLKSGKVVDLSRYPVPGFMQKYLDELYEAQ